MSSSAEIFEVFVAETGRGWSTWRELPKSFRINKNVFGGSLLKRKPKNDRVSQRLRHARGAANAATKVTEVQVLDMRRRYPQESQAALAREYRLDRSTVFAIVNRRTWAHI